VGERVPPVFDFHHYCRSISFARGPIREPRLLRTLRGSPAI
jgi:hypothetical protein